jgi:hypothetical protein
VILGFHLSFSSAFFGLPIKRSLKQKKKKEIQFLFLFKLTTSVGRKYFGLTVTRTIPVSFSFPIALIPSPSHLFTI